MVHGRSRPPSGACAGPAERDKCFRAPARPSDRHSQAPVAEFDATLKDEGKDEGRVTARVMVNVNLTCGPDDELPCQSPEREERPDLSESVLEAKRLG